MKRLAPKESGALQDSIVATAGGQSTPAGRQVPENRFAVSVGVYYARFVEFGTSKMHAKPFFLPAYRSLRSKIMGDLKKAVRSAVKGAGK